MPTFIFTISGHIEVTADNAEQAREKLTVTYPDKGMASKAFIIYEHDVFVYAIAGGATPVQTND